MKFYKVSHDGGRDIKVILANTRYEAIGFYLEEEVVDIGSESLDKVDVLPSDHRVEISCVGVPIYQTLEQIHNENDDWIFPRTVVSLIE